VGLVGGLAVEEAIPAERLASGSCFAGSPSGSENLAGPGFLFHTAATRSCSLEFRASSSGVGCACGMSGSVTSSVPYGDSTTTMRALSCFFPFDRVTATVPGLWSTSIG